jgi:hypothetical protein
MTAPGPQSTFTGQPVRFMASGSAATIIVRVAAVVRRRRAPRNRTGMTAKRPGAVSRRQARCSICAARPVAMCGVEFCFD